MPHLSGIDVHEEMHSDPMPIAAILPSGASLTEEFGGHLALHGSEALPAPFTSDDVSATATGVLRVSRGNRARLLSPKNCPHQPAIAAWQSRLLATRRFRFCPSR
jgi:hypothetical protein